MDTSEQLPTHPQKFLKRVIAEAHTSFDKHEIFYIDEITAEVISSLEKHLEDIQRKNNVSRQRRKRDGYDSNSNNEDFVSANKTWSKSNLEELKSPTDLYNLISENTTEFLNKYPSLLKRGTSVNHLRLPRMHATKTEKDNKIIIHLYFTAPSSNQEEFLTEFIFFVHKNT